MTCRLCAQPTEQVGSGVVKLHYASPAATTPCPASWKVPCPSCGLPVHAGAHVTDGTPACPPQPQHPPPHTE